MGKKRKVKRSRLTLAKMEQILQKARKSEGTPSEKTKLARKRLGIPGVNQ